MASLSTSISKLPQVPGTDPIRSPLDAFRIAVAVEINRAAPTLSLEKAYEGVDYGKKGPDFTVAMPRFRLGGKPNDWAQKVVENVRDLFTAPS